MASLVYLNGEILPRDQASVSALDYGFLYGYGLFETMRAFGGRAFRLERHLDRLARSAELLGLTVDNGTLAEAVAETLQANGLVNARVRIAVSAGQGRMPPDPATCSDPTVLILADEPRPYPDDKYSEGFSSIVSTIRRNSRSPLSGIKSANYLESLLARQEAGAAGVDEALFLNEKGLLAEASMSNLFLVCNDELLTPPVESGVLPGITREAVLELASLEGITTCKRDVSLEDLYRAQEAFLTNAGMGVMPLTKVEDRPIGMGRPGPVAERLMAAYRKLVSHECGLEEPDAS